MTRLKRGPTVRGGRDRGIVEGGESPPSKLIVKPPAVCHYLNETRRLSNLKGDFRVKCYLRPLRGFGQFVVTPERLLRGKCFVLEPPCGGLKDRRQSLRPLRVSGNSLSHLKGCFDFRRGSERIGGQENNLKENKKHCFAD
ncbi:hypothetical protein RRG08_014440 [Elysia crispata]|uniref:Uncharacterized protein n=1 Tax=Elysia crispata TaxID=231223 RepID=A0AAE0XNL8_9GAST|nr:hypothetical protein RRG08_014440 [Elysia crispata]